MCRLLLCLMLFSPLVTAQVYTYIDQDGNRVFTDRPTEGAKAIELAAPNAMPAPQARRLAPLPSADENKAKPALGYGLLRILVPGPDATVNNNAGDLIVTATSDPALQEGHAYRLILDGQVSGSPGRSPVFALSNLDRGTHHISVEIIDQGGRILEKTPSQPFHVRRVSLAQKRMVNPCKKNDYGVRPECPIADKPKEEGGMSILPFF
ncbi:DUF4124 domain-containing protein [Stutzerimonas azotifigens]|uniref:DUF4124 domain-containing protein n=1 Tax=Stutzerimonas azotifigens TaxID=291995 RepID=A0ABR5YZ17_9GAMM|nr:DUF4124 domain-containing protein [Stutzerimonas azotifigens]MBA1273188.1 DUF4124 domain-containing protein [Stutzerimonas azotifigens]